MSRKKVAKVALIGKTICIAGSKNSALVGIRGQIIDETKNTLKIQTKNKIKTLIKDQISIKINDKTIDGEKLSGRIEERIKQN